MIYAGFWPRFCALWLDFIFLSPLMALIWWCDEHSRLFQLYYFLPGTLFGLFYSVYLVHRFGGTPGKRVMKIKISKADGTPVGYREALLRYLPEALMTIALSIGTIMALLNLTDAQYFSANFLDRQKIITAAAPSWNSTIMIGLSIWTWSEFVVMLTNKKRRAIHDFIAGTVVIRSTPKQ
jgi:uncharacterized RDD family membrane protein YckC